MFVHLVIKKMLLKIMAFMENGSTKRYMMAILTAVILPGQKLLQTIPIPVNLKTTVSLYKKKIKTGITVFVPEIFNIKLIRFI